ncbi:MAG: alpha/beta hydrolase family protein [Gordonia amarae]
MTFHTARPRPHQPGRSSLTAVVTALSAVFTTVLAVIAGAGAAAAAPSHIVYNTKVDDQQVTLIVYSASMDKNIPVTVLVPRNRNRPSPTLYLLNGAGGGEDGAQWDQRTKYKQYFAKENVYVVTPIGGAFSYYTDWQKDDPQLGRNKWTTFLTKELPPLIESTFNTSKVRGIAGISMAGTSVLGLAISAPRLYRAVAGFSGCARTSDPLGQEYIKTVIGLRGGADVTNMWGPLDGPGWKANDPYLNAGKLRGTGTKVYLTAGTGLPGPYDRFDNPRVEGSPLVFADLIVQGGLIEAAVNKCTREVAARLRSLKVPLDLRLRPNGTHSWDYWESDLKATWPKLRVDLGA